MKLKFLTVICLSLTILSCTKKDKQTPRIESVEINGQFFNTRVKAGIDEIVTVKLKDDKELKQYVVELTAQNGLEAKNGLNLLSLSNAQNVSGKSNTETYTLTIPANTTAGLYELSTIAKDAAGNQSPNYKFGVIVESNGAPKLGGFGIIEGGERTIDYVFETSRGRSMRLVSKFTDNVGITSINVKVVNSFGKVEFNETKEFNTPVTEYNIEDLDFTIDIPTDAITGNHGLQWTVTDTDGNASFTQLGLRVVF
jgi:hypothetical protein